MRFWLALAPVFLLSFMALSCGDKGVPPPPEPVTNLRLISGNNQTPKAGAFLPDSFLVRVVTSTGIPLPDIEVSFEQITPVSGGYFVWNTARITDADGYAKNKYYADELVGLDSIRVVASGLDDSMVYFVLNVIPDNPDTIYRVQGNDQLNLGGLKLPNPCVARVTDKFGNPVAGHRVKFKTYYRCLVETDSSVHQINLSDSAITRTNSNGEASVEWIMTVNPMPFFPFWPNVLPTMYAIADFGDSTRQFVATSYDPGIFEYYYDVRDIFEEHCFSCHAGAIRQGGYALDFFYEVAGGDNLNPPDSSAPLLHYMKPINHSFVHNANLVEQDIVTNWVVAHDTAHGSSGLNNYSNNMKAIFDANCATGQCHTIGAPQASVYVLSSFSGLRGSGNDATPNAIPGDANSLLVEVISPGGIMRGNFGADSITLADSVINWVVGDSLRQY